jgi:hypothetical protein
MRRRGLVACSLFALFARPSPGQTQAAGGRPVLRVTGRLAGNERSFDLAALEALGSTELQTRTSWTGTAMQRFSGVPLARVLEAVEASGSELRATALNDYAITLPVEDATRHGAFLATRLEGEPLRVRDRGPVWLIYPWTQRPELDIPLYRERSIWQLRSIDVR